jgi:hypothetical protein
MEERIGTEFRAFIDGHAAEFGAIRQVFSDGLIVYIENAGEFFVLFDAIKALDSQKVIFQYDKLDSRLQHAIRQTGPAPA